MAFWREDAVRVNGFDERFEGYGGDDVEFAQRLVRSGILRYKLENLAVAYHFAHGGRVFDPGAVVRKFEEALSFLKNTVLPARFIPDPSGSNADRRLRRSHERLKR